MNDHTIAAAGGTLAYCLFELNKHLGSVSGRVQEAFLLAASAHQGQYRKGSGLDYIIHPTHVACILLKYGSPSENEVIAALLHDTVEDTDLTLREINEKFGYKVSSLVGDLTTPVYHSMKRANRVSAEAIRYGSAPRKVQDIKRCDMYGNVRSMYDVDPKFAPKYAREKLLIHRMMEGGSEPFKNLLDNMFAELGITDEPK